MDNNNNEGADRFEVRSPAEIAFILEAVMKAGEFVFASLSGGPDVVVTAITGVDRRGQAVLLDPSGDAEVNRRLSMARRVSFVSTHDRVKIQFESGEAVPVMLDGKPALRIPLPSTLLRFQRRDFFRIETPVVQPVRCMLRLEDKVVESRLVDISLGGVCITGFPFSLVLERGQALPGAHIDLGRAGLLLADLQVCNVIEFQLLNGALSRRAGCMFSRLPRGGEVMLQRYILQLERGMRGGLVGARR